MRYLAVAILAHLGRHPSRISSAFPVTSPISKFRFYSSATNLPMSSIKRVLVPIAEGSEEIETTCITDTLTRFGADVTVASVMPGTLLCKMSRGIKVRHDHAVVCIVRGVEKGMILTEPKWSSSMGLV
jgi:hypothetical protein